MAEPSTTWKETIAPNEETRFARFAEKLTTLQKQNAMQGRVGRALHHKQHGAFMAKLEIFDQLPEPARQGLFAVPKVYDAIVRYSNGSSLVQADEIADVRGMSVKVLGVDGPKVIGTARTQDFLGILQSSTPFRTPDEFVDLIWASRHSLLALPRMLFSLGLRTFSIVPNLLKAVKKPVGSLATQTFYSALPIQCGPYAIRFAFVPIATPEAEGILSGGPGRLGEDLESRLRRGPIDYHMEIQFFVDESRTPIEDGSVDWTIEVAPYVRVGRLTIHQQDASSDGVRGLGERAEKLSFDPWHALVEHRPLGAMMRARRVTYFASATGRAAEPEPDGPLT